MTALTAVTIQNTKGVKSVVSIPAKEISNQIIHTTKDIRPDAVKIGMLHSTQVINEVYKSLNKIKIKKIILDPVMIAKGGSKLITDQAIKVMKKKLLKKVSLVTPNIPEAEVLTGVKIKNEKEIKVFSNKKIITKNTHGTGCTLSTAITSFFSCGKNLKKSCELGIKYVNSAILTNPKIGKGHGPINHFNSIDLKKIFK